MTSVITRSGGNRSSKFDKYIWHSGQENVSIGQQMYTSIQNVSFDWLELIYWKS